ncbi:MAG: translation elongation factor 4 [bacterium]
MGEKKKIYNFVIIAHIDHGKSTLADRMLELTGTVEKRKMKEQLLDSMELEREKGITIKLQPVRMAWHNEILNLIDTPGHVDFQYEVSRSLAAVEGAVLLVDATQGVQAQTMTNLYLALEQSLEIIPVINKIDLPAAQVDRVKSEIGLLLGTSGDEILTISAKTGQGVERLLNAVVEKVPAVCAPTNAAGEAFRSLVFDSVYDDYKGVVAYVRVVDGEIRTGDEIAFLGTGAHDRAVEVGVFTPAFKATGILAAGEVGYVATGLKDIRKARVGDTLTHAARQYGGRPTPKALAGFSIPQAKVFAGIYPASGDDFARLREAVSKLQLNDASLTVQQEQSQVLGQGFRCGFLGMLHLEIVQERLIREYELDLVITTPSVLYRIETNDGEKIDVHTPAEFPDLSRVERTLEQYVEAEVVTPTKHLGLVFELMKQREAVLKQQEQLGPERMLLKYELPLRELVVNLYDRLKSATSGYGSLSYELTDWRETDVVRLNILINHEVIEALSVIVPRIKGDSVGRRAVGKLKKILPRQLFVVPLQAAIGGKIIARETLPAQRKDVTGHLYGGDVTRKRKLLEKQKKGKKRLAKSGSVEIPPEAYRAILTED